MRIEQTNPQKVEHVIITGADSDVVSILVDDASKSVGIDITPEQARELSVRLMQAADLADPSMVKNYRGRDWF